MKRLLPALLLMALASCTFDPLGFFFTSDVDARFRESADITAPHSLPIDTPFTSFTFVAASDLHLYHGADPRLSPLLTMLRSSNDAFLILCGDNVQNGDQSDFDALRDSLSHCTIPAYLAVGNHDLYSGGWPHFRPVFGKNAYTLSNGRVRIINLDSGNGTLGTLQREWLSALLSNAHELVIVIFMHFNIVNPDITNLQQFSDTEEIAYLMHLFEASGVDLVLMGHSHEWDDRTIDGVRYVALANLGGNDGGFYTRFKVAGDSVELENQAWLK